MIHPGNPMPASKDFEPRSGATVPLARGNLLRRIFVRGATFLAIALLVAVVLNHLAATVKVDSRPAGFTRGMIQGALMPMALPSLLFGRDVTIYAAENTGIPYKLGYTVGVNVCGAIFFGLLYWRLNRLRTWATPALRRYSQEPALPTPKGAGLPSNVSPGKGQEKRNVIRTSGD